MSRDTEREQVIVRLVALLKARREQLGLSLNETAWRAGLNHSMVLRVERRERTPTIDTLLRLAEALNVKLWLLLCDEPELLRERTGLAEPKSPTSAKRKPRRPKQATVGGAVRGSLRSAAALGGN
ncbi:MAG: helix-turn-helix transcriptional regulator [Puniceicoccales bacterium]|jgi:transcriptional regulator with XRE-family HTH domain|nr:helix-turn-helix transcriptional regulator [Puniceicoccales bacterium]